MTLSIAGVAIVDTYKVIVENDSISNSVSIHIRAESLMIKINACVNDNNRHTLTID